jgi:hypothetical protein
MSQFERGLEFSDSEDCITLEAPHKFSVFLPNQVVVVKKLLEEIEVFKHLT